jgi:hypothetical protein
MAAESSKRAMTFSECMNYRDHSKSVSGDCSSIDQVLSELIVRQDCPGLTHHT